ncbi:transposase [Roseobacter sp.]|uniref:transposase n=1 Tax=Roseobacter sp. TaxID=1907202 RepID=UPI003859F6DF
MAKPAGIALCSIPARLRRTATINQIRAVLLEQSTTARRSVAALRNSLPAILESGNDELPTRKLFIALQQDWIWLVERIKMTTSGIKTASETGPSCKRLIAIPGIGSLISTAMVAAVGKSEAYDRRRNFAAQLGRVPSQHCTGG